MSTIPGMPTANLSTLSTDEVADLLGVERAEVELADATMALVESYAATITDMRERRGMSRADLARLLDLTPGRITQLESGEIRHAVNLKTLAEIAHKLGFDVAPHVRDRREADMAATWEVDQAQDGMGDFAAAVTLTALTVAQVASMDPQAAGVSVRDLADRITLEHPEAADQTFVLQAAALVEEEEEDPSLANG